MEIKSLSKEKLITRNSTQIMANITPVIRSPETENETKIKLPITTNDIWNKPCKGNSNCSKVVIVAGKQGKVFANFL